MSGLVKLKYKLNELMCGEIRDLSLHKRLNKLINEMLEAEEKKVRQEILKEVIKKLDEVFKVHYGERYRQFALYEDVFDELNEMMEE